ncbi:hypothetical protein [uncultured Microbulbifer sp.]|uniref:hypothetical protein n=1 Tax=uncultured Microbulbifer sp. TaxID=348147 RepID=UPI002630BF12|nr:hypothetical protein [uncultured Microbulbifer sp.]
MKTFLVLFGVFLSMSVSASNQSFFEVGVGSQFGGLLGAKYAVAAGENRYFLGAGVSDFRGTSGREYGVSLGWERALSRKHSLGAFVLTKNYDVYTPTTFSQEAGLQPGTLESVVSNYIAGSYTFYFNGSDSQSVVAGASIGKKYIHSDFNTGLKSEMTFGFQLGYQF